MIAHTIQAALAPVFVLVAIGNMLNILSVRLGRIVDRARALQARHGETLGLEHDAVVAEMRVVDRRIDLIGKAFGILVFSALTIGTTVAALFLQEMAGLRLDMVVAGLFVLAISLMMVALVLFLHETRVAAASLRIPAELLEKHRDL